MKTSKKLLESIVKSVPPLVQKGQKEGSIEGYKLKFYIDEKPENTLFEIPLNLIMDGEIGMVYIGGKTK